MRIALVLALSLSLAGCASVASTVSSVVQDFSSSTPSQVSTLADAVSAATLITNSADVAVKTGKLSKATLEEIQTLSTSLHTALNQLEAANAAGQSLDYAAFNAALQAYESYATSEGIST